MVLHLKNGVKSLGGWMSLDTAFTGCQSHLRASPAGPLQLKLLIARDTQIPED